MYLLVVSMLLKELEVRLLINIILNICVLYINDIF